MYTIFASPPCTHFWSRRRFSWSSWRGGDKKYERHGCPPDGAAPCMCSCLIFFVFRVSAPALLRLFCIRYLRVFRQFALMCCPQHCILCARRLQIGGLLELSSSAKKMSHSKVFMSERDPAGAHFDRRGSSSPVGLSLHIALPTSTCEWPSGGADHSTPSISSSVTRPLHPFTQWHPPGQGRLRPTRFGRGCVEECFSCTVCCRWPHVCAVEGLGKRREWQAAAGGGATWVCLFDLVRSQP